MVEHRFAQGAPWVQEHTRPSVERDSKPFGPRNSPKQKFQSMLEADVANRAVDAVPSDPNVRVSEPVEPFSCSRRSTCGDGGEH